MLCNKSEEQIWSWCLRRLRSATFHCLILWKWAIITTKHEIIPGNIIPSLFHLQKSKGVLCKNRDQDIKREFTAEIFLLKMCLQCGLESVGFTINNAMYPFIYHRIQFKLYSTCMNCHKTSNSCFFQGDDLPLTCSGTLFIFVFLIVNDCSLGIQSIHTWGKH